MRKILNLENKHMIFGAYIQSSLETETSSKGNQVKWSKDGLWVKADFLGYEGLSECLASWVAANTNIGNFAPITKYHTCNLLMVESKSPHNGCYSINFLGKDESCITLGRLLETEVQGDCKKRFDKLSTKDKISTIVDIVSDITNIPNFGEWLTCLLEFDSLILNEDRHFFNIAVIATNSGYRIMNLFDSGAAFCSDTQKDYPLTIPTHICIRNVKSKPFSTDFKKQVNACRELYGTQLRVNLDSADIHDDLLSNFGIYSAEVQGRALSILRHQLDVWKKHSNESTALSKSNIFT